MKTLLKVLLLALFAVVVFIPNNKIASWAYWSLFLLMFFILFLYYRFTYYVSEKTVGVIDPFKFSVFCAKVPPMTSEDLIRGRLVVSDTHFKLYQKGVKGNEAISLVWQREIAEIATIETGRVVGLRNGLIFTLKDGKKDLFAISSSSKVYENLIATLGWTAV
ncbi:MAG: hypothetical protein EOM67_11720 [Spirochaetia bacterium]|nr:hypothetical protein [Spirochaetia bacterium]